jgi:hypothetical protein
MILRPRNANKTVSPSSQILLRQNAYIASPLKCLIYPNPSFDRKCLYKDLPVMSTVSRPLFANSVIIA